uniref:Uncharacterized protein n=1 Tax=Pyramimonas obovata TaxID=1411642 RepID=A0A7S0WWP0_9CHLO
MATATLHFAATRSVGVRTSHPSVRPRTVRVQAAKGEKPRKLGELRPNVTPRDRSAAPAKPSPAKPSPAKPTPAKADPVAAEEKAPAAEGSPASAKDIVYIGKGKFVKDDVRKYPNKENVLGLTGLTGGWAGGEKGLVEIRSEYTGVEKKEKVKEEPKVVYNAKTGKEISVSLAKDFGGAAGGWPGGEKGIYQFVETGEVLEDPKPPTLGWGPGVLALALVGAVGYNVYTSAPEVEVEAFSPEAAGESVTVKAAPAPKGGAPPPAAQALALKVAPYGAGAVVVGAGAVVAAKSLKGAAAKAADTISKSGRVVLLAAAVGAIAAKIVGVL